MRIFITSFATSERLTASDADLRSGREVLRENAVQDQMPFVLNRDGTYDLVVNEYLRAIPGAGAASRNTRLAYASDIVVWGRWLFEERRKSIWEANRKDVLAYEVARLDGDDSDPISRSTWNRNVVAIGGLYSFGQSQNRISSNPFVRIGGRSTPRWGAQRYGASDSGLMTVRAPKPKPNFLDREEFGVFRDVGVRGFARSRSVRRNPVHANRNSLFLDIAFTVGLRLEELSALLAIEMPTEVPIGVKSFKFSTPSAVSKGGKSRDVWMPTQVWKWACDYIEIERDEIVSGAIESGRYEGGDWLWSSRSSPRSLRWGGRTRKLGDIPARDRERLLVLRPDGEYEPAYLWLNSNGMPTKRGAWRSVFRNASDRCELLGYAVRATPHTLRHSYASYALQNLTRRLIESGPLPGSLAGEQIKKVAYEPNRQVQLMMGHESIETTMKYLETLPEVRAVIPEGIADGVVDRGTRLA